MEPSVTRPIRERVPPVVVGGVGGGGTRVVSQILDALGFQMRPVSIPSLDNVLFTSFFTLPAIAAAPRSFDDLAAFFIEREQWWDIFEHAMRGWGLTQRQLLEVERLANEWLVPAISRSARLDEARKRDLLGRVGDAVAHCRLPPRASPPGDMRWGWKEPNTSVFLPQIGTRFPGLKYIHVIRHGLDMAYSRNVNQVRSWGRLFGIETGDSPDPNACLEFWIRSNERTLFYARDALAGSFALVRFDNLVQEPAGVIPGLCRFLDVDIDDAALQRLCAIPSVPDSLGRYRERELSTLDPKLVQRVGEFGFEV